MKIFWINLYGISAFCWSGVVYTLHWSYWWIVVLMASYLFLVLTQPKIKWEPRDTWLGLFHDRVDCKWQHFPNSTTIHLHHKFRFYLVIIPCLPIIWDWTARSRHKTVPEAQHCAERFKTIWLFPFFVNPPI